MDYSLVKVWEVTVTTEFLLYVSAYVWFPVKNVVLSLESFLVLTISIERYLAVCRLGSHCDKMIKKEQGNVGM